MTDEMNLKPGGVSFVGGLVDAEVFAGRLKAGGTPVHLTGGVVPADTIFAQVVEEGRLWVEPLGNLSSGQACEIAVAVIQAIIDRTPSPATVVELTRILREGGVEVPEVTFD